MNWHKLTDVSQIETIKLESENQAILVYKHSTRCSISATALSRLERSWKSEKIKPYFLDLLSYGDISQKIAEAFKVEHQSPQVLLIKNGQSIYDASHLAISFDEIINNA